MRYTQTCPECQKLRPLPEHLIELALACDFLGNTAEGLAEGGESVVRTETIASWLRLAAQLETVKVNAWRYAPPDAAVCGISADQLSADSKSYGAYATALTRFMFVSNALEEAYRFFDKDYLSMVERAGIPEAKRKRTAGARVAALVDALDPGAWPEQFEHARDAFLSVFRIHATEHNVGLTGVDGVDPAGQGYALHVVRNVRNQVAHGLFPLTPTPEHHYGDDGEWQGLIQLLNHSCRVAALYIQTLLRRFSPGFQSHDYAAMTHANGLAFDRFIERCTMDYVGKLHMKGAFSIHGFDLGDDAP